MVFVQESGDQSALSVLEVDDVEDATCREDRGLWKHGRKIQYKNRCTDFEITFRI